MQLREDDDAGAGLEDALHLDLNVAADEVLGIVDHHHGPIVGVAYGLPFVFAFPHQAQGQRFSGQQDDAERLGDLVDVDAVDRLQLGDLAQVVIVGEQFSPQVARQPDELGVHVLLVREIAVMNSHFVARVAPDAIEHLEAVAAARALDRVAGIGHLLQFLQHEPRDDNQALEEIRLDEVGDAAVNDDAGVQQQQILGLVLRREPHVGNNERKILLVAAHGQDDADVTEAQEEAQADDPARGLLLDVLEQAGLVDEQGDDGAQEQAEGRRGKGAQGEALEHFVHGDHQPAEPKANHDAQQPAVREADKLRPHLADGVTAGGAQEQKQDANDPERHKLFGWKGVLG